SLRSADGSAASELDETRINLILEISDTGIGIPKAQQETIFGAFSQVSGQSTRKFGGTGLGLTITKRLTEMMRGTVRCAAIWARAARSGLCSRTWRSPSWPRPAHWLAMVAAISRNLSRRQFWWPTTW